MELSLVQFVGSIGGVAAVLFVLLWLLTRSMLSQWREDKKLSEDRLTGIIQSYNEVCKDHSEALKDHTKALTELTVYLKAKNGH